MTNKPNPFRQLLDLILTLLSGCIAIPFVGIVMVCLFALFSYFPVLFSAALITVGGIVFCSKG